MSLTWLHVSGFHIRGGDAYDRDLVLGALVKSVGRYAERDGQPDLIFATGDIAYSGKAAEYEIASRFFDDLLQAAGLDKSRLFIIPGNHDVDRERGVGLARTLDSREQADAYFDPKRPLMRLTSKLENYLHWHNQYFDSIRTAPNNSTCAPLFVELKGHRLGILALNSALFCQDDTDHGNLLIGRRSLDAALSQLKDYRADLKIALVHHPLEGLNAIESENIQAEIEARMHMLLRGHLHKTRIDVVTPAEGAVFRCAAGAAYQSRKWPNRALYATWTDDRVTIRPIRYEDSPLATWTTDPSVFPRDEKHQRSFEIPSLRPGPAVRTPRNPAPPARFRSNIPARGNLPFVGRDPLLEQMGSLLDDPGTEAVVVVHGEPGAGKSELAREFARQRRDGYSGGTFWVDASTDAIAIYLASIAKTTLGLEFPSGLPLDEQGQMAFLSLGATQTLLILDNAKSLDQIRRWLPLSGMPLHIVVTTLVDIAEVAWPCLEVERLSHAQSLELVEKLTDAEFAARHGERIAAHAGGLPVHIVPETTTLAYAQRRGRPGPKEPGVTAPAAQSFTAAYQRLDAPARLLLHAARFLNPQRIPVEELNRHLHAGIGWSDADIERASDACMDLHLLQGIGDLSMHQLFAEFLREVPLTAEEQTSLAKIRAAQRIRFLELAEVVEKNPADTQAVVRFMSYPLSAKAWEQAGRPIQTENGTWVGGALVRIGRFAEARPWFERAVAVAEKGDGNGRIDHDILGRLLHGVGYCLSSTGQYAEAQP